MTPVRWKAWYTDGREYASHRTSWADLPKEGALGFAAKLPSGFREVAYGRECYCLLPDAPDRVFGVPTESDGEFDGPREILERRMRKRHGDVDLKFGAWTGDADMGRVIEEVMAWV